MTTAPPIVVLAVPTLAYTCLGIPSRRWRQLKGLPIKFSWFDETGAMLMSVQEKNRFVGYGATNSAE
jgi:hypothetical protein